LSLKFLSRSDVFLVGASTIIIIFAVVITAAVQGSPENKFFQVITVGPVWNSDAWSCTSDEDFMIHGTLRSLGQGNTLKLGITAAGTQSLYELDPNQLETFSIGVPADQTIVITRTGIVTGFITMQTGTDAKASCTQV